VLHGTAENRIAQPAPQPRAEQRPRAEHRARHRKPAELAIQPVGDEAGRSYEDLYVEHAPAARRVALSMVPRDVADDIVAEAFTRVLSAIRAGGGPGLAFRAYLLTAVRNTAHDWLRASRRTTAVGDVETEVDEQRLPEENLGLARLSRGPEAEAEARAEARLVAQAFAKLPTRWRAVLWQLEVEAKAPAAIAPMFGLSANGVSALAVRAREGLRQAYLAEHVGANIPAACKAYAEALSADTRGRLSRRRQAAVHDHLTQCQSCHSLAGELTELNSRLGAILTPVALAGALGEGGRDLLQFGGLKAAAGTKATLGAKAGAGAKAAFSGHWRVWRLHPLAPVATATAGLAAAGGMVFAVSVTPLSPFHSSTVAERPAASSAQASAPALSPSATRGSAAGSAAGAASSALGGRTPSALAGGLASGTTGAGGASGAASPTAGGDTMTPSGLAAGAAGSVARGAPGASPSSSQGSVGSLVQGVGSGLGSTVQQVGSGAGSTVTGLGQGVNALTQAVGVTLGTTTSGLGAVVGGVTGSPALGNTVSGVGGAASGLVSGAGGAVSGVTGAVGGTVSGTTGAVGNTVSGVTGAVGGLLGGKKP
jgi:RNA polymerase sigma factor (sigma-70 family)